MFKIKRKLITAILLSLTVLSGCAKKDVGPVHIFSNESSSQTQSAVVSSSTQTTASESSSVSSTEASNASSSEQSSESSDTTKPPASTTSSQESESKPEIVEPDPVYSETVVYNYDPINYCTITFDGDSITVTGRRGNLFDGVKSIYPKMNITSSENNGILTCVLTPKSDSFDRNFGNFAILDRWKTENRIFIDLSHGSLRCPDTSVLVRNTETVLNNVTVTPEANVAQFITLDGSRDRIPEILAEVQRISDEICAGLDSDYEKLRAISRWVSDNIFYDHPIFNRGAPQYCLSLEYTLTNRSGICGSYATLTSALCAAQGIRCLNITGMALNNGICYLQDTVGAYHEWNVAIIDGREIIVDSGWNSGNGINNDGSVNVKHPKYKYFDISAEIFTLDHKAQTASYRDYFALLQ